jgi:release factor glutamine methyltransferase
VTAGEWITQAKHRLLLAGFEAPSLEAQVLAAHILEQTRSYVLGNPQADIDEEAAEHLVARRLAHEPLAYILGYREFYGRVFEVTPDVLIPRHETETIIDAFRSLHTLLPPAAAVLDIGTGSGCIAITLKQEFPALRVTAVDISRAALDVAESNADALEADVNFVQGDLLERLGTFHAIVSNPPYVAPKDYLPDEVKQFEPHVALFAGEDGLDTYRRMAGEAAEHIEGDYPLLLLEIGIGQAASVRELFIAGGWQFREGFKDLSGIERVLAFTR